MRLFTIGNDFMVELNKEWISLIPEFAALLRRDKGSPGDYRGDKKLKARREFSFIYFDLDFTSPIREWEPYERRTEAMKYAMLEESDMDGPLMEAHKKYNELLLQSSRSLKTLRAVEKSLNALDDYFENLDFTQKDNKGELLHSPNGYLLNLDRLGKSYDSVDKFKKRVEEELKGDASIRGQASLGRNEGKRETWEEGTSEPPAADSKPIEQTKFSDIAKLLGGEELDDEEDES